MANILATVTKAAKQTASGWVFDIVLSDGQTSGVWASKNTDLAQFAACQVGTQVELAVGNTPGKYFFNKIVGGPTAPAAPPPRPFPDADAIQSRPNGGYQAPAKKTPAELGAELTDIACAAWCRIAEKTWDAKVSPTSEDIQKLVATILISLNKMKDGD